MCQLQPKVNFPEMLFLPNADVSRWAADGTFCHWRQSQRSSSPLFNFHHTVTTTHPWISVIFHPFCPPQVALSLQSASPALNTHKAALPWTGRKGGEGNSCLASVSPNSSSCSSQSPETAEHQAHSIQIDPGRNLTAWTAGPIIVS